MADTMRRDGWTVLAKAVPEHLLATAEAAGDAALAEAGGPPTSREGAQDWVQAKRALRRSPALLDLMREEAGSALPAQVRRLLGVFYRPRCAQLVYRFPGEREDEYREREERTGEPWWAEDWHIDGMEPKQDRPFDALVGVALNDNLEPWRGNLAVFPGSHDVIASFFRLHDPRLATMGTLRDALHSDLQQRPGNGGDGGPTQVTMLRGDAVVANFLTAHVVAPYRHDHHGQQQRPPPRKVVYFRLAASSPPVSSRNLAFTDPWARWNNTHGGSGSSSKG